MDPWRLRGGHTRNVIRSVEAERIETNAMQASLASYVRRFPFLAFESCRAHEASPRAAAPARLVRARRDS